MKVSATFDFSDEHRRLVGRFLGRDGLASHIDCVAWMKCQTASSLATLTLAEEQKTERAERSTVMGAQLE